MRVGFSMVDNSLRPKNRPTIDCRLDIDDLFATDRRDTKNPKRTLFVAVNTEALARQIVALLDL